MSHQLTMNFAGKVRRDAPATSRAAALAVLPRTGTQRRRVLECIASWESATSEEIEQRLSMSGNTVRPRLVELREGGWVQDSGRKRKTSSGQEAIVWVLTLKGVAHLGKEG